MLKMYYVDTLKCELIGTNAYKLQAFLNEKVVVDGHGCHKALQFVSKLKKIKTSFLRYSSYMYSIKNL